MNSNRLHKNKYENIVYKTTIIVRLIQMKILQVLKFKTIVQVLKVKKKSKSLHYSLQNKMKIVLEEPK